VAALRLVSELPRAGMKGRGIREMEMKRSRSAVAGGSERSL
jgi:hypothetical protein